MSDVDRLDERIAECTGAALALLQVLSANGVIDHLPRMKAHADRIIGEWAAIIADHAVLGAKHGHKSERT